MASNYFRESLSELRKVSWPTRKVVITHTGLVILVSVVLMTFLSLLDFGLGTAFTSFITFLGLN